jgi:hypothetical protein
LICVVVGVTWLLLIVAAAAATNGFGGGWLWPIIFIGGSTYWFRMFKTSNPNQPAHAIHAWLGAVQRRKWERVDRLRVSSDRDTFPRRLPDANGAVEMQLGTVQDLEAYWKEARARHRTGYGRWMIRKPLVHPLGPTLAQVEFIISCQRFRQAWTFGVLAVFTAMLIAGLTFLVSVERTPDWIAAFPIVLVVLLMAMLVAAGWRKKFPMKKVVVFNDVEWRVLSGEWQAPEDRDLRWIQGGRNSGGYVGVAAQGLPPRS